MQAEIIRGADAGGIAGTCTSGAGRSPIDSSGVPDFADSMQQAQSEQQPAGAQAPAQSGNAPPDLPAASDVSADDQAGAPDDNVAAQGLTAPQTAFAQQHANVARAEDKSFTEGSGKGKHTPVTHESAHAHSPKPDRKGEAKAGVSAGPGEAANEPAQPAPQVVALGANPARAVHKDGIECAAGVSAQTAGATKGSTMQSASGTHAALAPVADAAADTAGGPDVASKTEITNAELSVPVAARADTSESLPVAVGRTDFAVTAQMAPGPFPTSAAPNGAGPALAAGNQQANTAGWTAMQQYEPGQAGRLEVGVAGGTWGWLSVRAELATGGGVHTFLRGTTADVESGLRAHAAPLQEFLRSQQLPVEAVGVEASRTSGAMREGFAQQGRDNHANHDSANNSDAERRSAAPATQVVQPESDDWMPSPLLQGGGGWVNVFA